MKIENLNCKQTELIEKLMNTIKEKFPEVELISVTENPDDSDTLWLNVTAPGDEDRAIELIEFGSDKATDILMDYGYHIMVMPTRKKENMVSSSNAAAQGFTIEGNPTDYLNKAINNLKAAKICFDSGCYDACVNRAYYAAFQAAIAALINNDITKGAFSHKWVQAQYCEQLIKRQKLFPAKWKSYLADMQAVKEQADFGYENISKKEAYHQMKKSEEMAFFTANVIKKC